MSELNERNLGELITERIRKQGRITFADFMAACLYEPGLGYYTSPGRKVGAEGDFYTSSNVHRVFGRLIARELLQMWRCMGEPSSFEIVEAGAAGGQLALDIMDTLSEIAPPFYKIVTYRFIEKEPSLKDAQIKRLQAHLPSLAWSDPSDLTTGKLTFSGCLLSNELIDSFPVHLVEMTGDGLKEVFVVEADGEGFGEELAEPSTPDIPHYLKRLGIELIKGQRAEINLAAVDWIASVAKGLQQGFVMTIDYGYPAQVLFAPGRMNGTLLCYYRHTTEDNPYIRPGRQDITSHVDFTTLMKRGEECRLDTVWFGEQYRFLLGVGIMEELMALESSSQSEEERIKLRLTLKKLMLPEGGMGDTFKVLIQAKGVENPRLACMRDWGNVS